MSTPTTYAVCEKCGGLNRVAFDSPPGKAPICGKCKSTLALHDGVSELSASSLQTLTNKSPIPVVVDFWAPWCGPCRSFAPTFIQAASRFKGQVVFAKINTEQHPQGSQRFGIKGIPTLMVFKNGQEINRVSGALPLEDFTRWLTQASRSSANTSSTNF